MRCDLTVNMDIDGDREMLMLCGAPIPRERCPFDNDLHTGCPYLVTEQMREHGFGPHEELT